jgi:multidrug transporter EmrE-like cation transporter
MPKRRPVQKKEPAMTVKELILVLIPVFIGAFGQIFLKKGMLQVGGFAIRNTNMLHKFIEIFLNPWVLTGFVFYFLSSLLWLIAISRIQLSIAYPMLSISYILVLVASWFLFNEPVTLVRWSGVAVICAGVYLISRS